MRQFLPYLLSAICPLPFSALSQLPTCSGLSSQIIYYAATTGGNIYNYDPSQPISAANPSTNTITLPTGANGLSVNENLNAASPSPTFYTTVSGYYYYYNGTTWTNTGHTSGANNANNMAGGGGYIYSLSAAAGGIYKYDGTGNATLLITVSGTNLVSDLDADCNGNFYFIDPAAALMRKYNSSGSVIQSWTVSSASNNAGGGFAIFGNKLYYNIAASATLDTMYFGVIGASSTISVNPIGSLSNLPADFGSCPLGTNVATVNTPLASYDCNTGRPDTLIAYGAGPFTWSVLSGPAVISGSGDTVTVTTSGNATLQLSSGALTYCGNNTQTITLNYTPLDTTLITTNAPVCVGDTLHLNGLNAVGATYTWSGPVSYSSSGPHANRPGMVLADSGYYKLSISFNGCSGSDSVLVNVKPLPGIPLLSSNSPICAGDTLKLHATDTSAGVGYSWSGPVSFSASNQNPLRLNVLTTYSGTYTAIANLDGCTASASTSVTVNPQLGPPTISISVLPGDTICAGSSINFSASVTNAGSPQYHWKKNSSNIGPNAATYSTTTAISGDIFSCEVQSNLNCQATDTAASNAITMYVIPLTTPSVSITSQPSVIIPLHTDTFTANVSNCTNPTYQWYRNGVAINGATMNPYITSLFNSDIITIAVHCTGCASPDSALSNSLTTGIGSLQSSNNNIKIWPNPVNSILYIQADVRIETIELFNVVGQCLLLQTAASEKASLNIKGLPPGIYLLRLNKQYTQRVTIE